MRKGRGVLGLAWRLFVLAALFFPSCLWGAGGYVQAFAAAEGQEAGAVFIDSRRQYEGMDAPFAKGYEPSVADDMMTLVVPFASDYKMEKKRITVGVGFESGQECPFYYKNYQKQVKLSEEGVYLYRCRLKLKEDRVNGQYPLYLWAEGKAGGNLFRQEFTIYIEITDGRAKAAEEVPGNGVPEDGGQAQMKGTSGDEDLFSDDKGTFSGEEGAQLAQEAGGGSQAADEKSSQPRLMVTENSLQGNALEAGTSMAWSIALQNCSSHNSVENVKITLLSESKDIVFEKNAWYFEKTGPKETMDLSQSLTVAKKAPAEPVQMQFQIEYEDGKGTSYTSTEEIRVLICQPQQARLANLSFPGQVYASDTEFLSFQVQNTGMSAIYNVTVRLEGKGLFPQQEVFLGNIDGGASADGEQKVFVGTLDMDAEGNVLENGGEKYGDTSGTVTLSYEDEQGQVTEQKVEISTSVQKADTAELHIEEPKPKTNQWWVTIFFFVISALVLAIIWLYLRMKHYQRMKV